MLKEKDKIIKIFPEWYSVVDLIEKVSLKNDIYITVIDKKTRNIKIFKSDDVSELYIYLKNNLVYHKDNHFIFKFEYITPFLDENNKNNIAIFMCETFYGKIKGFSKQLCFYANMYDGKLNKFRDKPSYLYFLSFDSFKKIIKYH